MGNDLVPYSEMERMAATLAKSGLFGIKDPAHAISLMLISQAEGKHPAIVMRDYDIISGRPSKKSEAMLRDFIAAGGKVQWHALDDTKADATFSHPSGGAVRITWDMIRAKAAGLDGKEMYRKYPRQMLRSRCVSEGCRTVAPIVTSGLYTPEEAADIPAVTSPVSLDQAIAQTIGALSEGERQKHFDAMDAAKTMEELKLAFQDAWRAAANDASARNVFQMGYDARKADLADAASAPEPQ